MEKVLILAPHPDDAEFSCGGTIYRFVEEGKKVFLAVFSPCNKSLPAGYEKDTLYTELGDSAEVLGLDPANIFTFNFPVREFPKFRQEILEELIILRKSIDPDLVLLPNSCDIHQDHHQLHLEGIRAFKLKKILGYELPWNNFESKTNFHIALQQRHLDAKWNALKAYKSQSFRTYLDADFITGLARVRGVQTGSVLAEGFELIHWVV